MRITTRCPSRGNTKISSYSHRPNSMSRKCCAKGFFIEINPVTGMGLSKLTKIVVASWRLLMLLMVLDGSLWWTDKQTTLTLELLCNWYCILQKHFQDGCLKKLQNALHWFSPVYWKWKKHGIFHMLLYPPKYV